MNNKKRPEHIDPKCFCPVPFTNLVLSPDGSVGCCRDLAGHGNFGNIQDKSYEELWNCEEIRAWRREFLEGNISERCKKNIAHTKCNTQEFNKYLLPYVEYTEYQDQLPVRLSPNFNGKCNLECVMCDSWTLGSGLYDTINFWENAEEKYFGNVKFVTPFSGEPFVQKDFYRLIRIMKTKSPDAMWELTTNGQWKLNNYVKKHLDMMGNIYSLQTSLDGATPAVFADVRRKGVLSKTLDNIEQQKIYRKERISRGLNNFEMSTMTTVIKKNWHEVPLIIKLMESLEVESQFLKCSGAEEQMIINYPLEMKLEVLDHFFSEIESKHMWRLFRVISPLIESLPEEPKLKYKAKYIKTTDPATFLKLVAEIK